MTKPPRSACPFPPILRRLSHWAVFAWVLLLEGLHGTGNVTWAQTAPPGWQVQPGQNGGVYYQSNDKLAHLADNSFAPEPGDKFDVTLEKTREAVARIAPCQGIRNAVARPILSGKARQVDWQDTRMRCTMIVVDRGRDADLLIAFEPVNSTAQSRQLAQNLAAGKLGASLTSPGTGGKNQTAAPQSQPPARSDVGDAELKKAIALVPAANRPVAIVLRATAGASIGGIATVNFEPWMVFANGYAVDCYNWDPAILSPSPASLGRAGKECDLVRWRKVAGGYELQDGNGGWDKTTWDEPTDASGFAPIRPGQRWQALFEAQSTINASEAIGGLGQIIINKRWLRLTGDGSILFDNTRYETDIHEERSRVAATRRAQYYLEGYLMALRDPSGQISRHFVFVISERGSPSFIIVDGSQYERVDQ